MSTVQHTRARLPKRIREILEGQSLATVLMIAATLVSLTLANSPWAGAYISLWDSAWIPSTHFTWAHVVNEVLMAIFFLYVGLDIKRELIAGSLTDMRAATLPLACALGGMIVPALIYLAINATSPYHAGWGIPMATDIAFALAVLSLLGSRVPTSLRVLLTTLAVADDLGAIIVIAVCYTAHIAWWYLVAAAVIYIVMWWLGKRIALPLGIYLLVGVPLWYAMYMSGVHSTIAGVLLASLIPYSTATSPDTMDRLIAKLHVPVYYLIMPLFALCNTAISFGEINLGSIVSPLGIGVIVGLVVGKPLGIMAAAWASIKLQWCKLPTDVNGYQLLGISVLGGIGFTMSIFIALLALDGNDLVTAAKVSILIGSILSAGIGYAILRYRD
jgi:Na+:H+ antiporter, NhaA family